MTTKRCHTCKRTPAEGHDYRDGVKPICTVCFRRVVATQGKHGMDKGND